MISQIITGVQNKSRHEYGLRKIVIRFFTNGIRKQVSAANRSSAYSIRNEPEEFSLVTYNELGNRVTISWITEIFPDIYEDRMLFSINTSNHGVINKVHKTSTRYLEDIRHSNGQYPLFPINISNKIIHFGGVDCVSITFRIYITSKYTILLWCYCVGILFRGGANTEVRSSVMVWKYNGKAY